MSKSRRSTGAVERALLVGKLLADGYPPDHEVILYEAATLPVDRALMAPIALDALVEASPSMQATLVIPPARPMRRDDAMIERLRQAGRWSTRDAFAGGRGRTAEHREAAPA